MTSSRFRAHPGLTRRSFAKSLGALGLAAVSVPLLGRAARAEPQMTYFTWGGYEVPEMHAAFLEKYGASPNIALFGDDEEGLQKVRGGFDAGLRQGMVCRVTRGTTEIGEILLVELRPGHSAALILSVVSNQSIRAGDVASVKTLKL